MAYPILSPEARFLAYEQADRPLCRLCGDDTRKRAVFFDIRRRAPLCARCAVAVLTKWVENQQTAIRREQRARDRLSQFGVLR